MGVTFDEIMDIKDLADFNRDLETVRSFINLVRVRGFNPSDGRMIKPESEV